MILDPNSIAIPPMARWLANGSKRLLFRTGSRHDAELITVIDWNMVGILFSFKEYDDIVQEMLPWSSVDRIKEYEDA